MGIMTHEDKKAEIKFELNWQRSDIAHKDIFYSDGINFWRDCFPKPLYEALVRATPGQKIEYHLKAGEHLPGHSSGAIHRIKKNQFEMNSSGNTGRYQRLGRFYPKTLLNGMAGIYKGNMTPFRIIESNDSHLTVDFNHPLAGEDADLAVTLMAVREKPIERGGTCMDWIETITEGPGMQARINAATDFFSDDPFKREDETEDGVFYEPARIVGHIDRQASKIVSEIYGKILTPGMAVLDLMSSWQSHLPENSAFEKVTGLGMNAEELARNPVLSDYVVHDLNIHPSLPFGDETFDAAICTVSVEYLTNPFAVFREILRVVKPDGYLAMTFSNRWFPPKAISIWKELHEFERMGLVTEYFLESGGYKNIHTQSERGWPRPEDDKYVREILYSDPVYAVWGQKK